MTLPSKMECRRPSRCSHSKSELGAMVEEQWYPQDPLCDGRVISVSPHALPEVSLSHRDARIPLTFVTLSLPSSGAGTERRLAGDNSREYGVLDPSALLTAGGKKTGGGLRRETVMLSEEGETVASRDLRMAFRLVSPRTLRACGSSCS